MIVGEALSPALLQAVDWTAEASGDWLSVLGHLGPWVLLAGLIALLARAIATRERYRAVSILSEEDRRALEDHIAEAERRTVGEVVVVVLERSDRHPAADWIAALLFALLGSALLAAQLPWDRPEWLLPCQILLGVAGWLCCRGLPGFQRLFISEKRATEMAAEQAFQEFYAQGLHRTEAATGVLIFISLLERRVIVLGDEGIAAKVPTEHWRQTDEAILEGIRAGALRRGLEEGLQRCADVLEEHFPWHTGDRDEIPNHVIVRHE